MVFSWCSFVGLRVASSVGRGFLRIATGRHILRQKVGFLLSFQGMEDMEQTIKWKVVCSGNIRAGLDKQQVVDNLAQLNINPAQANRLVSGTPITVKQDLEQSVAFRFKSRLEQAGLEVELKRMPRKLASSIHNLSVEPIEAEQHNTGDAKSPGAESSLRPGEMQCPKCKHAQAESEECRRCGIIISRYLQKNIEPASSSFPEDEAEEQLDRQPPFWETNLGKLAVVAATCGLLLIANSLFSSGAGYQRIGNSPEASAVTAMVLEGAKLTPPAPREINQLLEAGRYDEVEFMLRELDDKTRGDVVWEDAYQTMVDAFSPENKFRIETLDSWVNETESSWAYLARGSYYVSAAGLARGDKLAKYTSETQFSNYRILQEKAYRSLKKAKDKNANIMPVYTLLLMVADTQRSDVYIKDVLDQAISVNPAGFYYRYQYLRHLMPKWGGSYSQMASFVDDTSQYHSLNPRLNALQGYAKGEEGFLAMKREDYQSCISLYSEALQFGANAGWLRYRANCLTRIQEYDKAMEDVSLSLQIHEDDFARQLHNWLSART